MNQVSQILEEKGDEVLQIEAEASVHEAVKQMVAANVASLLVSEGGEITGIITERDYLRRVTAEGRTDEGTSVREIMSSPLIVVTPQTSIDECMALMTDRRIRHIPVVDDGGERGRHRFDRRRRQVQVEAAELRDQVPARVHRREIKSDAWNRGFRLLNLLS